MPGLADTAWPWRPPRTTKAPASTWGNSSCSSTLGVPVRLPWVFLKPLRVVGRRRGQKSETRSGHWTDWVNMHSIYFTVVPTVAFLCRGTSGRECHGFVLYSNKHVVGTGKTVQWKPVGLVEHLPSGTARNKRDHISGEEQTQCMQSAKTHQDPF